MRLLRYLPRFRDAYRALPGLAWRETWQRHQIEAYQLERLNEVWLHARTHVPHYRQLAAQRGLPQRYGSLEEFRERMPILTKAEVNRDHRSLLSDRAAPGFWKQTSGSTATMMPVYWGREAYLRKLRARYRFFQSWGIDFLDRSAFLWGHATSFAPGLAGWWQRRRQPIEDWFRSRLRLSAYSTAPQTLRRYLRQMAAHRPLSLYAYSSAAYLLALEAKEAGPRCDSLRLITLSGETAYPHMKATIEDVFGVPTVIEYGSMDCGLIASEGPDRTIRVREDLVYLESRPREDGRFDIVVTVLYNPSYPLLRYEIGDALDTAIEYPGQGFACLSNVMGRSLDLLVSRTGDLVHPFTVEEFVIDQVGARRWRIHQASDGTLKVVVAFRDRSQVPDLNRIQRQLSALVGGYPARVEVVDEVPVLPSGKCRYVTSDLAGAITTERTAASLPDAPREFPPFLSDEVRA